MRATTSRGAWDLTSYRWEGSQWFAFVRYPRPVHFLHEDEVPDALFVSFPCVMGTVLDPVSRPAPYMDGLPYASDQDWHDLDKYDYCPMGSP